jgi:hypothetical protein
MRRQSSFVVRLARMRDAKKNVRARRKEKKKERLKTRRDRNTKSRIREGTPKRTAGGTSRASRRLGWADGRGTYLPLKLASFAALLGALMSFTPVSISACLVGVRANPSEALACSSPPIARLAFGARAVMEKHAREGAFSP